MRRYVLAGLLLALVAMIPLSSTDAEDIAVDRVLIDMGNGETYWSEIGAPEDAISIASHAASEHGLTIESDSARITRIGDMENHSVAGRACSWRLYGWEDGIWSERTGTAYSGGSIAWGFYPTGGFPVETPEHMTAWIQYRGDSNSSGISDSYGTAKAVSPAEWYRTYRTGYVDSSLIVAGDRVYHTTYGETSTDGVRSHAFLYCLDRFTSEQKWRFDLTTGEGTYPDTKDNGYNITSPLIIGDMVLVNSATSHDSGGKTVMATYLIDRITGELIDYEEVAHDPPVNEKGRVIWNGRTFINGGTSPVYDSGAVYFSTSDGRVLSFAVSRADGIEQLWEFVPSSAVKDGEYVGSRGSFYYFSPVVSDIDGKRVLFVGNYEGYMFAVDASNGSLIWEKRLIALFGDNRVHRNTPGQVALIVETGGDRLAVICNDGGMSSISGFLVCIDKRTGEGPDGKPYHWKIDGVFQGTVPYGDDVILYGKKSSNRTSEEGASEVAIDGLHRIGADGEEVWSVESNLIWSRLTMADGIVYAMEYSAGFYDDGGHLVAFSPEDGSTFWSIKLEPYSRSSYSMAAPTVIEGKIYAANDYGAVYCVSETGGKRWDGGGEIILPGGFYHWSWALLFAIAIAAVVALIRYYRGVIN